MFAPLTTTRLRHSTAWVLAAWLCVLMAGVWAPVARAHHQHHHAVHLCSGELTPLGAPSPIAALDQDTALHHVLDCPLCMPVLAPPPPTLPSAAVAGISQHVPSMLAGTHIAPSVALPPARAPPFKTLVFA